MKGSFGSLQFVVKRSFGSLQKVFSGKERGIFNKRGEVLCVLAALVCCGRVCTHNKTKHKVQLRN